MFLLVGAMKAAPTLNFCFQRLLSGDFQHNDIDKPRPDTPTGTVPKTLSSDDRRHLARIRPAASHFAGPTHVQGPSLRPRIVGRKNL